MQLHPLRAYIFDELHSRPPLDLTRPTRLKTLVFFFEEDTGQQFRILQAVCADMGIAPPSASVNYFRRMEAGVGIEWSLHTEFVRYSFIEPLESPASTVGGASGMGLSAWPFAGELLVASEIDVMPQDEGHGGVDIALQGDLRLSRAAWLSEGVTRYVVRTGPDGWAEVGGVVQKVLEIEIYLCLTLLALPIAKRQMRELDHFGLGLRDLTRCAGEPARRDMGLLQQLEDLAALLEGHIAECQYRFSASRAYHRLVQGRVEELEGASVGALRELKTLIDRRLAPAMMTCDTVERRHEKLAARLQRTTALLRARVEVVHEQQNRALLAGMSHRAELQLRLQQTVEGLSVWVLSYYAVGLAAYLLKAGGHLGWIADPVIAVAALVPAFVIFFYWRVAQARHPGLHLEGGPGRSSKECSP